MATYTINGQPVDAFTRAYIEAALWSSTDEGDNEKRIAQELGYTLESRREGPEGEEPKTYWYFVIGGDESIASFEHEYEAWAAAFKDSMDGYYQHRGTHTDSNLETHYSAEDIDADSLRYIIADCTEFQKSNRGLMWSAVERLHGEYDDKDAGHDFWLTRNRHGVGFWDRGLGDVGAKLTESAKAYGECDIYVGDDGKLHVL